MKARNIVVAAVMVVLAIASPRGLALSERGFGAIGSTRVEGDIIEQVLVKVNGEIITKTDLEARQIAALRQKNPEPAS